MYDPDSGKTFTGNQGANPQGGVNWQTPTTASAAGLTVFNPNNTAAAQNNVIFWGDAAQATILDLSINGVNIRNDSIRGLNQAIAFINTFTAPNDTRPGTGVRAVPKADGSGIEFVNDNSNGSTDSMKNIHLEVHQANTAGEQWNINLAPNPPTYTAPAANANNTVWIPGQNQREVRILVVDKPKDQFF